MTAEHITDPTRPDIPIKNPIIPLAAPLFRGFHSDSLATCNKITRLHLIPLDFLLDRLIPPLLSPNVSQLKVIFDIKSGIRLSKNNSNLATLNSHYKR